MGGGARFTQPVGEEHGEEEEKEEEQGGEEEEENGGGGKGRRNSAKDLGTSEDLRRLPKTSKNQRKPTKTNENGVIARVAETVHYDTFCESVWEKILAQGAPPSPAPTILEVSSDEE